MFGGSVRPDEGETVEITLWDGTVVRGRVVKSIPNDDGGYTLEITWETGE